MNIPKGPEIKLPKFSRKGKDREKGEAVARAAAPAARKRPSVEMPPFANDLYRDLRDRNLLIPVVVLLVALIAVPVLLRSSADPAAPAAVPVVPVEPIASVPVVPAEPAPAAASTIDDDSVSSIASALGVGVRNCWSKGLLCLRASRRLR